MKRAIPRAGWLSAGLASAYLGTIAFGNTNGFNFGMTGRTITAGPTPISRFHDTPNGLVSSLQQTNTQVSFQRVYIPALISFSRVDVPVILTIASSADAATGNIGITSGCVVYSLTGSTLSPIVGTTATTNYSWASNSANYSSVLGGRLVSFPLATMLTPGDYLVGLHISTTNNSSVGTSTTQLANTISMILGSSYSASGFNDFGALTNISSSGFEVGRGLCSVTISATSMTFQLSQISQSGSAGVAANYDMVFRNY